MRNKSLLILAVIFFAGAFSWYSHGADKKERRTCMLLVEEFGRTLVALGEAKGQKMAPAQVEQITKQAIKQMPGVFKTTRAEEKRLKSKTYNDKENLKKLTQILKDLEGFAAMLPAVHTYLARQHEAGKLKGLRLELSVRLFQALLDKVAKAVAE